MSDESKRILIVDDNEPLAQTFQDVFDINGFVSDIALNGAQAIELCRKYSYAVAIVDIRLSDMDGDKLTGRLIEIIPSLKSILVTGHGHPGLEKELLGKNGIVAFFHKPLKIDSLIEKIESLLDNQPD